jgi:hypothetical protein
MRRHDHPARRRHRRNVQAAGRSLGALTRSWGCETVDVPAEASPAAGAMGRDDGKVVDPVSAAALVLSIPSSVLAVQDLADRIRERRRAQELIGQAQHLAAQQVTVSVRSGSRTADLSTLTPDQLLDLLVGDDPAS